MLAGRRAMKLDRRRMSGVRSLLTALPFVFSPASAAPVNFAHDIAPIIFRNCAPCHRPGEAGPFPLLTYQDVAKKAKTIAAVTQARYMPPWPADPSYSHFIGERVLGNDEIQMIKQWVENGAPAGDPAKLPPPPAFPQGYVYGKPELLV